MLLQTEPICGERCLKVVTSGVVIVRAKGGLWVWTTWVGVPENSPSSEHNLFTFLYTFMSIQVFEGYL